MTTAAQRLHHTRTLRAAMKAEGHELTLAEAVTMVHLAETVAARMAAEQRAEARWDRVRRGMVANHVAELRAVGCWDGE